MFYPVLCIWQSLFSDLTTVLVQLHKVNFIDDKEGKPVGINSHAGQLEKALNEAQTKGWTVVDMMQDWNTISPPQQTSSVHVVSTGATNTRRR